jgi:predicted metal-binding protein
VRYIVRVEVRRQDEYHVEAVDEVEACERAVRVALSEHDGYNTADAVYIEEVVE